MTPPAYPAARAAAARVHPRYARNLDDPELLPDVEAIEAIIDVAFWASLRREEVWTPRVSLAFATPARVEMPLMFERPVPLASEPLTRLGPAVERPGIHLCISRKDGHLAIWGAARELPEFCFVLEVIAPGLLVVKQSRGEAGKFINVAVLQGDDLKVVDPFAAIAEHLPGLQPDLKPAAAANVLTQLAVSMRAHGRGGSLLVVPPDSELWRESILQPIIYSVSPPFRALTDLLRETPEERLRRRWQESLHRIVEGLAGLTAVDGATIITRKHELVGFGAKIVRRHGWQRVSSVLITEPIEGTAGAITEPSQLGGTRHLSAAQFAHDQRDAIAMVASQDGRFTVFGWSPREEMVHAYRIETLLL